MTGFWRQTYEIARKDLRNEFRSGEVVMITIPFGAVAMMIVPLAIGTDAALLRTIGPGIYWSIILLFGVLISVRQSSEEGRSQRDLLALLGIDPAARYAGGAIANALLLLIMEAVLAPVAIALYDIKLEGWLWLLPLVPLVAIGLALLGTLAAGISSSIATTTLVPLIVVPLSVPMVLAASQIVEGLQIDATIVGWFLLLVIMDLLLAVIGVVSAGPLQEAAE